MSGSSPRRATAFAPASVGNVAVGFDVLGLAFEVVGDTVTVEKVDTPDETVVIDTVDGASGGIPLDVRGNTAGAALLALAADQRLSFGFRVRIDKGIPLASGMGGSAASAVGAVVAANALLEQPLEPGDLCTYAVAGEAVASGAAHADNVAPCLYGGLTLVVSHAPPEIVSIPVPKRHACALVHPDLKVETRSAREVLADTVPLKLHVRQSARLGALIAGCFRTDVDLISHGLEDLVIEPQRARLVPGFERVKRSALEAGALGASISGAGPSLFAWCRSDRSAEPVKEAMIRAFANEGIRAQGWTAPIAGRGAHIVEAV